VTALAEYCAGLGADKAGAADDEDLHIVLSLSMTGETQFF
jgi:hypothetical protein